MRNEARRWVVKQLSLATLNRSLETWDRGWVAAYLQGDTELFDRIWIDGFIFTLPFGQFTNKEQEIANIKSGDLAFESLFRIGQTKNQAGDSKMTTSGNT